jgi:hypothetical protein
MATSPRSGNADSPASGHAEATPRWRSDLRVLSIPLASMAVVFTFSGCLLTTPGAVHSFCGTCRGLSRMELRSETVWVAALCLAAWLLALASGSRLAVRIATSAAAASSGMWLAVWGWW